MEENRWKYLHDSIECKYDYEEEDFIKWLDEKGSQGWELVSYTKTERLDYRNETEYVYSAVFKRPYIVEKIIL